MVNAGISFSVPAAPQKVSRSLGHSVVKAVKRRPHLLSPIAILSYSVRTRNPILNQPTVHAHAHRRPALISSEWRYDRRPGVVFVRSAGPDPVYVVAYTSSPFDVGNQEMTIT